MAPAKITPPIVGVPCFDKCDCGPSSLSICPTFSLFKIGITSIPKATVATKDSNSILI